MNLHFKGTVKLDEILKDGKLSEEDLQRVKQIPAKMIKVPCYKTQSSAYAAIDWLIDSSPSAMRKALKEGWFSDVGTPETQISGMRRLVASLAYALKEQRSDVVKCEERKVVVVGNEFFYSGAAAARYAKRLAKEEQTDVSRFPDQAFQKIHLANKQVIRACSIFWIDCPNHVAYVQTLDPKGKITASIQYLDARGA